MKIESTGKSPSGHPVINLRLGVPDLVIIRGLIQNGLQYMPKIAGTEKTVERMRAMSRCFNSAPVAQWMEHGDSTSNVAGSNPAGGISFSRFAEIWRESGLSDYYERMDDLKRIGYTFDSNGDMDHDESEALKCWLGDRDVMGVPLAEFEKMLPAIKFAADVLRAQIR